MENPKEMISACISDAELERRWKATREMMKDHGIDFLLARNDEEFLGGYVRWFTDIPARHSYPYTVIFPLDNEMTLISTGSKPPDEPSPASWAVRGVKQRLNAPYFPSIHYTAPYDAELAVGVLKEKKGATIGMVGRSYLPVNFCEYLWKHLPDARFVDITEEIDQIKIIKSPEEIEFIKLTAKLQDTAMEQLRKIIRPGMRDFEVYAEAHYATTLLGSERALILVGSGHQGTPAPFRSRHFQNSVIKEDDQISVLLETNGPAGFYTELGRIFSVGNPSQELVDAFEISVEAQRISLDLLKPGVDPALMWNANNDFLEKKGYNPERRLYAHGQGYDLVERPLIRYDEPLKIQAGMNLTIHPTAVSRTVWAGVTDNYLVTKNGVGPCLHGTPKEIIII